MAALVLEDMAAREDWERLRVPVVARADGLKGLYFAVERRRGGDWDVSNMLDYI